MKKADEFCLEYTLFKNGNRVKELTRTLCTGIVNSIDSFATSNLAVNGMCLSAYVNETIQPVKQTTFAKAGIPEPTDARLKDKDIYSVAIMPCTSKKFEASRPEHSTSGSLDVDASLTTRELARMIKQAGINFAELPDEEFDQPFGLATGAGVIFGTTGGVMEAAIRTVYEKLEGKPLDDLNVTAVRGLDGVKEATLKIAGKDVKIAVAHGTKNARIILEKVKAGEHYDFIEVMACPGGCIHGGGQPIVDAKTKAKVDVKALRAKALYSEDEAATLRKSHENPYIQALYDEYFGEPCSHKAHELLHTTYTKRDKF